MTGKSDVPALERGLDVLEAVAAQGPMGYKAIADRVSVPPASLARILKSLCRRDYLSKSPETGDYRLGQSPHALVQSEDPSVRLRQVGCPVVNQLRDTLKQTALMFYWNGMVWECLCKAGHEDSITMQNQGEIRVDVFGYPWSPFAYEQVTREQRRLALDMDEKRMRTMLAEYDANGYVINRGSAFSRLTVAIKDKADDLVGALAVGIVQPELDKAEERRIADLLMAGRDQIRERYLQVSN